jgi:erythromycin esterase-like protein
MVVVGFGTGEGKYTAIRPGAGLTGRNDLKPPPAGSLEKACRDAGLTDFAVDLRPSSTEPAAKWLARPHLFRSIGALAMENQFQPRVVPAEFDVLIYIDKTTASKCFGFAPAPGAKD